MKHKQWLEISSTAFEKNLNILKDLSQKEILMVVKANAYGHGIKEIVQLAQNFEIGWFGVDNIDEALFLRKNFGDEIKVLILGYTLHCRLEEAIENNISFTIYNIETIEKLQSLSPKKRFNIHLKIESGMNRQGVLSEELPDFVFKLQNISNLVIEGVSTHFAEPEDLQFTKKQIDSFSKSVEQLKSLEVTPHYIHSSASSAILYAQDAPGNLVRTGRAAYGFIGSFLPILTWKTVVAQIKMVEVGKSVGYGHTWTAEKPTKIAVIPVGYSDGYDRKLSNRGRVLIGGHYAPVIGRVAMNMFMVDISDMYDVKVEEEVVIIGKQGNNEILIDELAEHANSIAHEIVARINPNIYKLII